MTTAAAETTGTAPSRSLGDLVDRQDAFNGAEGYIKGDSIVLRADSQIDAGLAIKLKEPVSGRMELEYKGAPESGPLTIQFIKAGPNYDYTKDKIIDQKIFTPHNEAKGVAFNVPEGTDKIVVMMVGRGSFDVNMSNTKILEPVAIPSEAICTELKDLNIGLQYYPGIEYKSDGPHWFSSMEFVKQKDGESYIFKDAGGGYSSGGGASGEVVLDLTRGILYSCEHFAGNDPNGDYKIDGKALRLYRDSRYWENDKESLILGLNNLINSIKDSKKWCGSKSLQGMPPEMQSLVKLLEAYVAKYKDAK
jgi:hypothetical protein